MATNSATVVAASLDSSQLEASINSLVNMVALKTKAMADNFTSEVKRMENAVKNLGNIKIDSGGAADSLISKQTKAQNNATQATDRRVQKEKELNMTLDQGGDILQKVARYASEVRLPDAAKSARESFQAFYKGFNEQARQIEPLIQSWEKLLQARHTGNIEQVAQKIAQVRHEIAELVKEQANLSKTKPQGYLDEIAKRNPQIKALRDQLVSLETEHQKLKASDPFKDNPYLNTLREKLQGVRSAMNDADTTNRRWLQTTQQLTEAQKKSVEEQMKLFYSRTMKIPTDQYDMQIVKLERIQSLLQSYRRGEVSFTPAQLSELEKEERTLLSIVGAHREIYQTQQHVTSSTQQATQSAQRYTEEIRKQAQAIRESAQWREKGFFTIGETSFYNPDTSKLPQKERLSLEEQIYLAQTKQIEAAAQQEKVQQDVTQAVARTAKMEENVHLAQRRQNEWAAQKGMSKTVSDDVANLRTQIADLLGVQEREVKMINVERASYDELSAYIKQLQQAYRNLGGDIAGKHGKDIADELQRAQREAQKLQQLMSRPTSLKAAMGLNENTLDDIAYKMRQLASYRSGLNVDTQNKEINAVNQEYDRLKKKMDEVMQKNSNMIASNNALGRSWNYMKNRLAFYFTVGASTQFVKNLIDIRGQYELLERSIGILIDSAQNGSQIFAELNSMAIKSPFTTMELGAAAKQLVAYDVAAKDVVETTRRLADMAAAVGIPIERLTYALGQIKAYGYLNARDARMFANAGIPLVKELADRYTELEGRLVSTSDVYDRIKKKAISYEDVMATVNKMTDEGGKFFNFQEKAADTIKVRIANLTLAWNNMMNEMGAANQGVLSSGLKTLSDVFKNWRSIYNLITSIIVTFGVLKGTQIAVLTMQAMKLKENITLWNALEISMRKSIGAAFVNQLRSIGGLLAKFANPVYLAAAAVTALSVALLKTFYDYQDLIAANEAFNKSISDNAKENIESIDKFFEDYKKQLSNVGGLNSADQEKLWERIQEEIEKTTKNAKEYIDVLNDVAKTSSKIQFGEEILEHSKTMQDELKRLADSGTFSIGGGFANDSAAENLQKYQEALNEIRQEYGSVDAAIEAHTLKSRKLMAEYETQRDEVRKELNDFVSKLDSAYIPDILGQSDDVRIQMANVRSFAESLRDAFLATEKGSKIGADGIVMLNNAIDKWITKQGVANNLIVNANGEFDEQRARIENNKTAWEEFFRYISNKDKEYLDAAIKTNNIGSDEVKKIWDKAAEEMSKRSTTSYNLIQDQIAELRNTPDIVINVVYKNAKQKLDKDQEEFEKRFILPEGTGAWSTDEYLKKEKENREKYGTLMRKQGEDTVEYEKRISDERKTNLELQKKNGDIIEENKNKTDAYSQSVTEQARKEKKAADDRLKAIKEIEDAGGYDFSTKSENTAARKAQKQAESELAKALKDELSTIDKVRSIYKDLTKEGMSHADAVAKATRGWDETVNAINKVLQKNGLRKLNLSEFVGTDNPREMLKTLQAQLEEMVKRGASASEIKVIQEKIRTLEVDADKYDLTKITKGLNNELDRLKEEYELAVSLDADPELGNMFADWMGIDVNDLPRTAQEYANEASKVLNSELKKLGANIELPNLLSITDDDMRAFEQNKTLTQAQLELVKRRVEEARGFYKKEVDDRIKGWNMLLEKYSEYEYKISKIQNDAAKERVAFAQQFGSDEEKSTALKLQTKILAATDPQEKQKLIDQLQELILSIAGNDRTKVNLAVAIDTKNKQDLAKSSFEEFQKSPEWIVATGNLAGLTDTALKGLISSIENFKKKAKNLSPKQIKEINKALRELDKERKKNNPFQAFAISAQNAKERMEAFDESIKETEKEIDSLSNSQDSSNLEDTGKKIMTLTDRLRKLKEARDEAGNIDATEIVANINGIVQVASQATQMFTDMADALGGQHMTEATQTIKDVTGVLEKAGQGAAIGASIGKGWGALIGGVAGGLSGLITTFADRWSGNKAITDSVKDSERAVKQLELAYVDLQQAVDKAYGTAVIGAKQAALANKELQLAEIQRQIQLEKSRSSKNRDEDKIIDLQKQYRELFYEIKNGYTEIVDDLMGTDVASFAENLVSSMIDAFKQGEDYMKVFSDKFDEMIDNMIMKSIVSRVVSQELDKIWKDVDQYINERTKLESEDAAMAHNEAVRRANLSDEEIKRSLSLLRGESPFFGFSTVTQKDIDEYRKAALAEEDAAQARLKAASAFTGSDVDYLMGRVTEVMPELGQKLKDILGEYYKFGESSETQLSSLQQGIAGVSEETAGAVEAYLNGMSQQAYLRNDLLTQIRDAIVGFNLDVQVATMSQILLQLQSSYAVQMAIQGILEGWSSPSGLAVRVEMQ